MFGVDDAIIGGAISSAGQLAAGWLGSRGAEESNAQNIALAREQMKFQKGMSDTAYQRAVADMKAAGLNPMLLAKGATPASTPSGATTTVQSSKDKMADSIANATNLLSMQQQRAQIANTNANTAKTVAETAEPQVIADFINMIRKKAPEVADALQSWWKHRQPGSMGGSSALAMAKTVPEINKIKERMNKKMSDEGVQRQIDRDLKQWKEEHPSSYAPWINLLKKLF